MYKASDDGPKYKELQEIHRTSGCSRSLSVTIAPKATYREGDILRMLDHHYPEPTIVISDDFVAHKTNAVHDLLWSRNKYA